MQKTVVIALVVAFCAGAVGFYGGTRYAASESPAARFAAGGAGAGFVSRAAGAGRTSGFGGGVFGTIISKDASSITVQLPAATTSTATTGTKIVLVNTSTQISKTVSGSTNDLSIGQSVMIAGSPNSDGSITASMIQIRPSGSGGRGVQIQSQQ